MKNIFALTSVAVILTAVLLLSSVRAQDASNPMPVTSTNVFGWLNDYAPGEVTLFTARAFDATGTTGQTNRIVTTTNEVAIGSLIGGFSNGVYALSVSAYGPGGSSLWSSNLFVQWWSNRPHPPHGLFKR